jgi:hypothetical protein
VILDGGKCGCRLGKQRYHGTCSHLRSAFCFQSTSHKPAVIYPWINRGA